MCRVAPDGRHHPDTDGDPQHYEEAFAGGKREPRGSFPWQLNLFGKPQSGDTQDRCAHQEDPPGPPFVFPTVLRPWSKASDAQPLFGVGT